MAGSQSSLNVSFIIMCTVKALKYIMFIGFRKNKSKLNLESNHKHRFTVLFGEHAHEDAQKMKL